MGKRSPGPMSYIREASALRNIKLCYAGRSFSIRVVIRCLHTGYGFTRYSLYAGKSKTYSWSIKNSTSSLKRDTTFLPI